MPWLIFIAAIINCSIGFSKTFIILITFFGVTSFILACIESTKDSNSDPLYPKEDEEKGGD